MSDARGRTVTPRITPSHVDEQGEHGRRAQDLAAKRITDLTGVKLEQEKLLQQLEEKKRKVGPGLDRAGCTFVTKDRARGFYDDEDFERVVKIKDVGTMGIDLKRWGL